MRNAGATVTLHFLHVGKTGGTAIKRGLRQAGLAYWASDQSADVPETPYGRIELHHHRFHMRDVPPGDYVFFCLRDPITRFLSGFHSRLNKGQPRYYFEWTERERAAFERFPTPQLLAAGLASDDPDERQAAQAAMRHIRHLRPMHRSVGTPPQLRRRLGQVVYVARQETLDDDWQQLKARLGLPEHVRLPSGARHAHRGDSARGATLDRDAVQNLRQWYRRDYELLEFCDRLRSWRRWGPPAPNGRPRLHHELGRLRAAGVFLPRPTGVRRRLGLR